MQTHFYYRFSLLLALLASLSFRASAQVTTAAAESAITVYLTNTGQVTVSTTQLNRGSSTTTSCGPVTLSLLKDGMPAGTVSVVGNEYYNGNINTLDGPTVTAPANTIFVSVDFASYGTPFINGSTYTINSNCHAANSKSYVESKLLGRSSYSFADTDVFEVFGDPCGGTKKRLAIKASYASSQVTFTTAGQHTATLIATDACGNISSATPTTVNVVDVRCGSGEKYNICHNGRQLCVDAAALAGHLGHGDTYGACPSSRATATTPVAVETVPNPAPNGYFRVHVLANTDGPVQISLIDMQGTSVAQLFEGNLKAGEEREFSVNNPTLREGLYLVRVQSSQKASSTRIEIRK
ncbi:T9SS type A sorting domain-containing protein [Hymenobacter sp. BT186]|uniref:T9SS type A sorting domain-containing protein n=1 Tax=Hymenobacter telluris TaxID=2816474 RepID=A0A939EVS4_9BACT|nr:T9SS type A sorting domain-containing protein [Hymenobacter telluris]MBO0357412.1 T9SS type A sorting domain-containing protein [Hymenobacter telluris]MBW3373438.1 T9SS type A sorting domain-containing protein [Hymenobacter norwichensis]